MSDFASERHVCVCVISHEHMMLQVDEVTLLRDKGRAVQSLGLWVILLSLLPNHYLNDLR